MADDIATRLRDVTVMSWDGEEITDELAEEAADEIERLRSENERLSESLTNALRLLAARKEARRG